MKSNIVLIGMPGSGKTTIGKILSRELGMSYLDIDYEIEKFSQQSIPDLFKKGEAHFRDIESQVTKICATKTGSVIATGGGIILKEENMTVLKEQGFIVFLDRSVEDIAQEVDMQSRPLLKGGTSKLYHLYESRIALYRAYSDKSITNFTSIDDTIATIIKAIPQNFITERGINR